MSRDKRDIAGTRAGQVHEAPRRKAGTDGTHPFRGVPVSRPGALPLRPVGLRGGSRTIRVSTFQRALREGGTKRAPVVLPLTGHSRFPAVTTYLDNDHLAGIASEPDRLPLFKPNHRHPRFTTGHGERTRHAADDSRSLAGPSQGAPIAGGSEPQRSTLSDGFES